MRFLFSLVATDAFQEFIFGFAQVVQQARVISLPVGIEELAELVSPLCHAEQVDRQRLVLMCPVFFVHRICFPLCGWLSTLFKQAGLTWFSVTHGAVPSRNGPT